MRACNCGETLRSSVQKNAAETSVAKNARPRYVERADMLIAPRACLQRAFRASNFLRALPQQNQTLSKLTARTSSVVAGVPARFITALKSDRMISPGSIGGCRSGQDESRVRAILHVRIGIGHISTEIQVSKVAPAV